MELRFISCSTNEHNENLVQRSAGLRPRIVAQCFGLFYTINYGRFFILVLLGHEIEKKVDKSQTHKK